MIKIQNDIHNKTQNLTCIWIFIMLINVLFVIQCEIGTQAQQTIISENTTWTLANSPHIIPGNVLVEEGVTLTIEPGVEVKFDGKYFLQIEGNLIAEGTENNMITFTSNKEVPVPGNWDRIIFKENADNNSLKYCEIKYADYGIFVDGSSAPAISITHNYISYNHYSGIYFNYKCPSPVSIINISNNFIGFNSIRGIVFYLSDVVDSTKKIIIDNNTIMSNEGQGGIIIKNLDFNGDANISFLNNNIYNNTRYNVEIDENVHYSELDFTYNWWGTTDMDVINQSIYDYHDDFNLAKINYEPYLTEFNNEAPDHVYLNPPPNIPTIPSGRTSGIINTSYSYETSTSDLDEDQLKYGWDWDGDGTVDEWSKFVDSETDDDRSHSWSAAGSYIVKVKAVDEHGGESEWSDGLTMNITEEPVDTDIDENNYTFVLMLIIVIIIVIILVGIVIFKIKRK